VTSGETLVTLIGGPPGAGKSTLGRAVAARLGCGSLTVDHLLTAAQVVTNADSHPEFHQVSGVGHVQYFTESPKEGLISDAVAQEDAVWPMVERIIHSHLSSQSPLVIDWWLLRPRLVAAIEDERVRSVWLHIDPKTLWERERHNTSWMSGSSDPQRMLDNFMHRSLWRNELDASEAESLGLHVLHLTGDEPVDALVDRVLGEA
jgi:2-phosphoglycerate kinase